MIFNLSVMVKKYFSLLFVVPCWKYRNISFNYQILYICNNLDREICFCQGNCKSRIFNNYDISASFRFWSTVADWFDCDENKRHKYTRTEQDANSRAIRYFHKRNVLKWRFDKNPIGGEDQWDMKNIMDKNGQFTFLFERALNAARMGHRSPSPLSEKDIESLNKPITF